MDREIVRQVIVALHGSSHRTEIDIHSATFRAGIVKDIEATLEFIRAADSKHFEGMCSSTGFAPYSPQASQVTPPEATPDPRAAG